MHRPHVVIAGGGVAGVEALLALRELAGPRLSIELIAPEPDLVYRPLAVAAPFGTEEVRRFPLAEVCADQQAHLRADALEFVDARRRRVETESGAHVAYDHLVLATGARRRAPLAGALTFDGAKGIADFRALLADLDRGTAHAVLFAQPGATTWHLPLYELALMTAATRPQARLSLSTPEHEPLEAFGRPASERMRELLSERGIALHTRSTPLEVARGSLLTSRGALLADRIVTLPEIEGPRLPGVPHDAHGFVPVDGHGRVLGLEHVYAAGDGAAHPVKQGGLAAQQADAIAEMIASRVGVPVRPAPFRPELRAQLLTGTLPWYFRTGPSAGAPQAASRSPLWWPPGKVAARYLAPYLADRLHAQLGGEPLADRAPHEVDETEQEAALDLALTLADEEAESGERAAALRWLAAAEAVTGTLPPAYVEKRRRWSKAAGEEGPRVAQPGEAPHRA